MTATIDLHALVRAAPLKPAVQVLALAHPALPSVLRMGLPGVRYLASRVGRDEEHLLVDDASGSAARIRIAWCSTLARTRCDAGEIGPRRLYDELAAIAPTLLQRPDLLVADGSGM